MTDLCESFLENDYNPFILFNKDGKVKFLNREAQYLLGYVSSNEIYQLALSYANISYGFKTTFIELEYEQFNFFAISVGYKNDEEIGIKLYRYPQIKFDHITEKEADFINIYKILDLCLSAFSTKYSVDFIKDIDPTLPNIRLDIQKFIKLLNKSLEVFKDSNRIKIRLHIKIGENVKIKNRKFSIFSIDLIGNKKEIKDFENLKILAKSLNSYIETKKNLISINIPMITS